MELAEIGDALGLEKRTLRYILEQGIVPGLEDVNQGRGYRRKLKVREAQLVAVAGVLHEQGFRGPVVQTMLKQAKTQLRQQPPLLQFVIKHGCGTTEMFMPTEKILEAI